MTENKYILRFFASLILSALILLFVHSELDFFSEHSDECKTVDICLILDKVHLDHHHSANDFIKIFAEYFSVSNFDFSIHKFDYTENINSNSNDYIISNNKIYKINRLLLI